MIARAHRLLVTIGLAMTLTGHPSLAQTTRNMQVLAHLDEYHAPSGWGYSSCWSYLHSDGREYAVIGTANGTAIYNVTNPATTYRVGFIAGRNSIWREMKSYRDWIYVSTESYGTTGIAPGIQIIRMTDPEHPVLVATYAVNFQTSHTVAIDTTRALLICNGTRFWSGGSGFASGMRILSLANPEAPVEIGWWPGGAIPVATDKYVHDSVPVGNRLFASSIYYGIERVFDFSVPSVPMEIHSWTYPGGFSHNSWPDASGNVLYVTDEVNGQPLKIFDITNVMAPVLANTITANPQAIVHNAHVKGSELYLSNYTEGIRVLDLTDPRHPAEFAWADSWPGASGGFNGVWEVCPFFTSGTVIASDMTSGLYVYRPVRDYGLLCVRVVDQATGDPLSGVEVTLTSQGDSLVTPVDGMVMFAPSAGMHSVIARKFDYQSAPMNDPIANGDRDTVVIAIPTSDLAVTVRDAVTLAPLGESYVHLEPWASGVTDGAGHSTFADLPEGEYTLEVHAPGHVTAEISGVVDASDHALDLRLRPTATWDALETESGWAVGAAGDNATSGIWTRVDPLGTGSQPAARRAPSRPLELEAVADPEGTRLPRVVPEHEDIGEILAIGSVQPETDRSPAPGTMCFVTGQGTTTNQNDQDVDGGKTSLTSPPFDLSGMAEPTIGYWRWFYGQTAPFDWLAVLISNDNGVNWTPVDTTRATANAWVERTIDVASYVAPTSQVRVRFVAADFGDSSIVEAAIDDIVTFDAALPPTGAPPLGLPARLSFRAPSPNPARGAVALSLELPGAGEVAVEVLDLAGRHVRTLHRGPATAGVLHLRWNGEDDAGRGAAAGLYFVRARTGAAVAETRVVRVN